MEQLQSLMNEAAASGRALEWAAALLGIINVGLLIRRSVWNYPFGLAMVALYASVFLRARLYADAALQVFFFAIQIYGWIHWTRSRDAAGLVIVERLSRPAVVAYGVAAFTGAAFIGTMLLRTTDAAFPYWDSTIAALSVAAQVMMARRRLENWVVWIVVDLLAIGLFTVKGLYPTAALYLIFLLMSVAGLFTWRKSYLAKRAL